MSGGGAAGRCAQLLARAHTPLPTSPRAHRILRQPLGNALLLGVGGSGRRSLARLAAHIQDYEVATIEVSKGYGAQEWRDDLRRVLKRAGLEGRDTVFLLADGQVVQEGFLEDVNNILNAGARAAQNRQCTRACAAAAAPPTGRLRAHTHTCPAPRPQATCPT